MKRSPILALIVLSVGLSGCATHHAELKDLSTDVAVTKNKDGTITTNTTTRTITTELTGRTVFSSAQIIEKLKALQTDKTQSIGAGTISQQGATNVVGGLVEVVNLLKEINKLKSPLPGIEYTIP